MSIYLGNTLISGVNTPIEGPRNIGQIIASTIPLTDAGLHLLDGTLIQGGGAYSQFVNAIGDLYDNTTTLVSNITKIGSVIDNDCVLSGFGTNNYGKLPFSFNPSSYSWEIKFKITTGVIDGTYQNILATTQGTTNEGRYGLRFGISSDNKFYFDLGTSSSSWVTITSTYTPTTNTVYYIKCTFDGSVYKLGISTDDTTYTEFTTSNSTPTLTSVVTYIGTWTNYNDSWAYFKGSIDLNESYININNSRWWSGANKACFIDEPMWQNTVNTYGVCGKFVYDSVNNTVRLPKYNSKIYTGGGTAPVVGNGMTLGLTNGTYNVGLRGGSTTGVTLLNGSTLIYGSPIGSATNESQSLNGTTVGITTDPTKSGIIADLANITTSLDGYYYIVIATSTKTDIQVDIDEIATDLNGKADTDLNNVNNQAKVLMSGMGMPSSTYNNLTLGASGTTYTAPSNGWFWLEKISNGNSQYVDFIVNDNNNNYKYTVSIFYSIGSTQRHLFPVLKGDKVTISYTAGGSTNYFRFIYAKGSESEA